MERFGPAGLGILSLLKEGLFSKHGYFMASLRHRRAVPWLRRAGRSVITVSSNNFTVLLVGGAHGVSIMLLGISCPSGAGCTAQPSTLHVHAARSPTSLAIRAQSKRSLSFFSPLGVQCKHAHWCGSWAFRLEIDIVNSHEMGALTGVLCGGGRTSNGQAGVARFARRFGTGTNWF